MDPSGKPSGAGERTLVVGAGVRRLDGSHPDGGARAVVVHGEAIAWIGDPDAAPVTDNRIDVDGWITPAFVDAHVHATATGLAAEGLSLAGCASLGEALARLRAHAAENAVDPLLGGKWDDFGWPEQRPPHAEEISAAAPGRTVLLERVDAHSCVVDGGTLSQLPLDELEEVVRDAEGRPTGWLKESASQYARSRVNARVSSERLDRARATVCSQAAALGIASFHEMGHPGLSGPGDAQAWAEGAWPIDVLVWWAELDAASGGHGPRRVRRGGDLFLDGSIGSSTAAISGTYRDGDGDGMLLHLDDDVATFFRQATRQGQGAGVHAIGDRAIEQALSALESTARECGTQTVRDCRHRLEHVELASPGHVARMAALGVVASVQPAFDAEWGGDQGLYAQRFGASIALRSNPLAWFAEAGVPMAFGSDSTVTPMDPWGAVAAAQGHRGGHRLDRETAWRAHTLGGRYVAGQDDVGPLAEDRRADMAVWDADPLRVDDVRTLSCLATFVRGRRILNTVDR
jgi:predicted amidohydrolase YtcJ